MLLGRGSSGVVRRSQQRAGARFYLPKSSTPFKHWKRVTNPIEESQRLDLVAGRYDPSDPATEFDFYLKRLQAKAIGGWLLGERVLEMGCATGELASLVAEGASVYEIVEGSTQNIDATRARVPHAIFHHALFEDFTPSTPFSDILLVCALEHVIDPRDVLARASRWLQPGGRMHVVVPNANSFHRHVGTAMGILERTTDLSDSDLRIGHRRVYDIDSLLSDFRKAGLQPLHWQGIFLKVLSNKQMLDWDWSLIQALDEVARLVPGHAAELYVVAVAG